MVRNQQRTVKRVSLTGHVSAVGVPTTLNTRPRYAKSVLAPLSGSNKAVRLWKEPEEERLLRGLRSSSSESYDALVGRGGVAVADVAGEREGAGGGTGRKKAARVAPTDQRSMARGE